MTFNIDLEGKRALVTGSGQGVGRAIATFMAQAGADVIVNDFVAERAESVVEEIKKEGGKATAVPFDVSNFDQVMEGVGATGGLDILVNNAGNAGPEGWNFQAFHETVPADWDRYFAVNMYGVMNCTRAALPNMIDKSWGRIITIVSDAGRNGEPRMAAYSAAKAAAAGFTRSIARDLGRFGVTANNVAIASIDPTGGTMDDATGFGPDQIEDRKKRMRPYIIRRMGRPEDIAAMVLFLSSPLTPWITGQTYPVNGGFTVNQ